MSLYRSAISNKTRDDAYGDVREASSLKHQANDLEAVIYSHLEEAGKLGNSELQADLGLGNIMSKSYHIQKAAESAEMAGWEKEKIASMLWSIVEKNAYNISRRLIYEVCTPLGYVRTWGDDEEEESQSATNAQKNSSNIYCADCNAYHTQAELDEENAPLVEVADLQISHWQGVKSKCGTQHVCSKIPKHILEEGLYLLRKNAENNSQEWDGRQDVSERNFPPFVLSAVAKADKATQLFVQWVKKWIPLSGKQTNKIVHLRTTIGHPYFNPQTEKEAWEIGFQGKTCVFKKCIDCEKRQKEELRNMRVFDEKPPTDVKVNINSRADAKRCRICGGTNLREMGCGERRLMFGTDAIPVLTVKCAHCHEEFPPLRENPPVSMGTILEGSQITHTNTRY